MAFEATEAGGLLLRRGIGRAERTALVLGAVAVALGAAAWIADSTQTASFASAALPGDGDQISFQQRFSALGTEPQADQLTLKPPARPALTVLETKLWDAKALLAQKLMYGDWRTASLEDSRPNEDEAKPSETPAPAATPDIPLPRPRPAVASVETQPAAAVASADNAAAPDNRTLFQKLSDLVPGRITLASLAPEGGLFRHRPDLASLGYGSSTAVYDISARTVYLPNGASLEAHSGYGRLRDDPEHVNQRMVGATPPAVYDLKLRENLFHGVQAIRMTPADGSTVFGRSGLLAHSYMLGPDGDSNGCVSIRDYDRFLKAFNDGEITRLVVVPSLNGAVSASQRTTSSQS